MARREAGLAADRKADAPMSTIASAEAILIALQIMYVASVYVVRNST